MKTLFDHYLDQGNIGGDPTDVYIDTIKGNSLLITADKLIAQYIIQSTVSNFSVNFKFGSIPNIEIENLILGDNYIEIFLIKPSSSTAYKGFVKTTNNSNTSVNYFYSTWDLNYDHDIILKLILQDLSEEPADNTVVAKLGTGYIIPAS